MIKFNKQTKKFELYHNGKAVIKSANKIYIARRAAQMGIKVGNQEMAVTEERPQQPAVQFGINERFEFIRRFVRMVARGVSHSLIVAGPGGLGKTWTVTKTLNDLGKKEMGIGDLEGDYVVVKGHSTAKALYRTLWENNSKTVIFDDCDSVFKDPIGANILKAALDSYDKRVISWNAEFSEREELPNRFEFIGRVIFISNYSIGQMPQAIVSRSLKCDVTMTTEEKVERIITVMKSRDFCPNTDSSAKDDVIKFIRKNADKFTDLNIRSATTILKIRVEFEDEDWEKTALYTAVA